MKRLFVGIPVPEELREKIKPVQDSLIKIGGDLTLVSLENLHFTLKFLGNKDESKIPQIAQKLEAVALQIKKFAFSVRGMGVFPNKDHLSVVWVGAESKELALLMKEVNRSLDYIRRSEHEEEILHLTIARVKSGKNKEQLRNAVEGFGSTVFGKILVDRIVLFESVLTPLGPAYTMVKEFPLR